MAILVTGGTGYIGSHICVELLNAGYDLVLADNLCNSSRDVTDRIEKITNKQFSFYECDLRNRGDIEEIFNEQSIDGVIHLAAYKAVGESVKFPLKYYENNLTLLLNLLMVMDKNRVKRLVFSSSAAVYGDPQSVPITEDFPLKTVNPYGATKLMAEQILKDMRAADQGWNISILRYFNPIGAHLTGLIGEEPRGIPGNLVPYITQAACGKLEHLKVFGNTYPTKDGTCIRDYIHVVDLAKGHVAALQKLEENAGLFVYNLGTGKGYSVLDVIHAFETANKIKIPYIIAPPREGDVAQCYADTAKAARELGFKTQFSLEDMCKDAWNWQNYKERCSSK